MHMQPFYQSLHCLLRLNRSSEKEIKYFFENYNLCPLSIYNGQSFFIVCSYMENSFDLKWVKVEAKMIFLLKESTMLI